MMCACVRMRLKHITGRRLENTGLLVRCARRHDASAGRQAATSTVMFNTMMYENDNYKRSATSSGISMER